MEASFFGSLFIFFNKIIIDIFVDHHRIQKTIRFFKERREKRREKRKRKRENKRQKNANAGNEISNETPMISDKRAAVNCAEKQFKSSTISNGKVGVAHTVGNDSSSKTRDNHDFAKIPSSSRSNFPSTSQGRYTIFDNSYKHSGGNLHNPSRPAQSCWRPQNTPDCITNCLTCRTYPWPNLSHEEIDMFSQYVALDCEFVGVGAKGQISALGISLKLVAY